MSVMSDQQAFAKLKGFFENRRACVVAAEPLKAKVEIGIVINKNLPCAFFKQKDGKPKFEQREAVKPDVVFFLKPEGVDALLDDDTDDVAELGARLVKLYLGGMMDIKVPGSMFNLLTNGYLGIYRAGGLPFAKFIGAHGLSSLGKIKEFVQKLRQKS